MTANVDHVVRMVHVVGIARIVRSSVSVIVFPLSRAPQSLARLKTDAVPAAKPIINFDPLKRSPRAH
jgi:hypothetical protein